ncbi:MAG: Gfo/Idh/MocA family protein [Candidatus Neomarinimicrobiota bacterium]
MKHKPVKIGVIGVGHLGQHHVKHYNNLQDANLIGIFDTNKKRAKEISNKYNVKYFKKINLLLKEVEAISIVTTTKYHSEIAELCIKNNIHAFIEKPITATLEEADRILVMAKEKKVVIQVGHIERLNPALLALEPYLIKPKFIEIQRLAPYTSRGTDVPVVLDKMIHDIDIVLSLVNSTIKNIQATGLSILTDSIDIAHARLCFNNGTVASIMSSRIAKNEVRKLKLFEKDLYATIDLLLGITEIYKTSNKKNESNKSIVTIPFDYKNKKIYITYDKPSLVQDDPLYMELKNFLKSVQGLQEPIVSGKEGRNALDIAIQIQQMIIKDMN